MSEAGEEMDEHVDEKLETGTSGVEPDGNEVLQEVEGSGNDDKFVSHPLDSSSAWPGVTDSIDSFFMSATGTGNSLGLVTS